MLIQCDLVIWLAAVCPFLTGCYKQLLHRYCVTSPQWRPFSTASLFTMNNATHCWYHIQYMAWPNILACPNLCVRTCMFRNNWALGPIIVRTGARRDHLTPSAEKVAKSALFQSVQSKCQHLPPQLSVCRAMCPLCFQFGKHVCFHLSLNALKSGRTLGPIDADVRKDSLSALPQDSSVTGVYDSRE